MVSTSPTTFKSIVTPDFSRANVLVRTNLSGSQRIEETLAAIRAYVAKHFPADLTVHPTGTLVLLTGTTSDIVTGQIESLSLALGGHLRGDGADVPVGEGRLPGDPAERVADRASSSA